MAIFALNHSMLFDDMLESMFWIP